MHHISLRHGLRSFSARRRRTVSRDTLSCAVSLTNSSASSSSVQRARPAGGLEHAVAPDPGLVPSIGSTARRFAARARSATVRKRSTPPPSESRGEVARLRSASVFGLASAVSLGPVSMRGEAESQAETALLRLVEALVQRLLGVGQAPQCRRPGGQCIRAIAQALSRIIGTLPGSAARRAPHHPLPAVVPERLLDGGP